MTPQYTPQRPGKQRGIALVLALVVLIGTSLISLAAVRTSVMELRMAGNTEDTSQVFQSALAAVDYTISDSSNLPTSGPLNTPAAVSLPTAIFPVGTGDSLSAKATRVVDCGAPPRARNGSSVLAYSSFVYEINAEMNYGTKGAATSTITQGYVLLGPKC